MASEREGRCLRIIFNCNAVCPNNNNNNSSNISLKKKEFRILSYNVAGLSNKSLYSEFYNFVNQFEFIFLYETFVEENNFSKFENKFPNYEFKWIPAFRIRERGRASGGCFFGFKRDLNNIDCDFKIMEDGIYVCLKFGQEKFCIIPSYLNCNHWQVDFEKLHEIAMYCSNQNICVIGDLNARVGKEGGTGNRIAGISRQSKDQMYNANGTKLLEFCDSFGLRVLNGTSLSDKYGEFTFVGGPGTSVNDYCLAGGEWSTLITDFEVKQVPYSDHLPIVVTFELMVTDNLSTRHMNLLPKLIWNNAKASAYRRQLEEKLQSQQYVDVDKIENIIKEVFPIINQSRNKNKRYKEPWFDNECRKARQLSFGWLKLFRIFNEDAMKDSYLKANREFKALCMARRRIYYESEARRLAQCNNSSDFWKLARKLNGGNYVIDRELSPTILQGHFDKLLNPSGSTPSIQYAMPGFQNDILDRPIVLRDVVEALSRLKDGKAAGSDGIPVEFYKYGTNELSANLTYLFNNILESGIIPQRFEEALIFPIYKKGCRANPENYRGISFLNASYKIFTAILQSRLTAWIDTNHLLKEYQAGFRPGYSTVDHVFVLTSIVESFLLRNKKLYAFFVDFRAAFDSVNRKALFYKLFGMGMSLKFGRVIESLYANTKAAVWNGEELSEWFRSGSGVRQGCALSPSLFALFIEDMVDLLPGGVEHAGVLIKALLFADDVVLLAYSPQSLQLMINRLSEYCKMWNLVVNLSKSQIMIFKKGGGRNCANERWHFDGETIQVVKEYKYLGVYFTRNLNMERHLREKLAKSKVAINTAWRKCFTNKYIAHSCKYKVFEAVSESILFYAAQVWGGKQFETVEKLLRFYIKRAFRLPLNTPNYMLMLETGLSPLFVKTLKLQVEYVVKVLSMPDYRLPKKAALQTIRSKTGWYKEWLDLASRCGMELSAEDTSSWKPKLYQLIERVDEQIREGFLEKASGSLHRSVYSRLCHNLEHNNYFRDEHSIEEIATVLKLRGELLKLNYIPHRDDLPIVCRMCNLSEREDIFHFVGRCPILRETRRSVFGNDVLSENQVIQILNEINVTKLSRYCKIALQYRDRILSENF